MRRRRSFRPARLSITGAVGRRGRRPGLREAGPAGPPPASNERPRRPERPDWWAAVEGQAWAERRSRGGPPGAGCPAGWAAGAGLRGCLQAAGSGGKLRPARRGRAPLYSMQSIRVPDANPGPTRASLGAPWAPTWKPSEPRGSTLRQSHGGRPRGATFAAAGKASWETAIAVPLQKKKKIVVLLPTRPKVQEREAAASKHAHVRRIRSRVSPTPARSARCLGLAPGVTG